MPSEKFKLSLCDRFFMRISKWIGRRKCTQWLFHYEQFHVYALPKIDLSETAQCGDSYHVEAVDSETHYRAMAECRAMDDPEAGAELFVNRAADGSNAYAIFSGDRLIGYQWLHTGANVLEDDDDYTMTMRSVDAYFYDAFISPDFRGKRLSLMLAAAMQEAHLGQHPDSVTYLTIDTQNIASLRSFDKLGVQLLETITFIRLFGLRIHRGKNATTSYSACHCTRTAFNSRSFPRD